jgi:response regulator RpfG family c-di-GMP phosphodiesterase
VIQLTENMKPPDEPHREPSFTILAVDDEPAVLSYLSRCLETVERWKVVVASGGQAALEYIEHAGPPAVVVADMHMPMMSGTTLLSRIGAAHPDTVRVLLTGHAGVDSAIDAVNVGQIFRFLTKPCEPALLRAAVGAAVDRYKVLAAERVLLEQTLQGTIKTLTDVLSMTNSLSFGRAMRIRRYVTGMSEKLKLASYWEIDVAAMLSQLGYVTLPVEITDRVYRQLPLTREETTVVNRIPLVTQQLLAHIPRLEIVRAILSEYETATVDAEAPPRDRAMTENEQRIVTQGARLLRVASDFDALESRGNSTAAALALMKRRGHYVPEMLVAIGELSAKRDHVVREVTLQEVEVGMVLAEDLTTAAGSVMVVRGYEFTRAFVQRCHGYPAGWLKEPIRVLVPV